jgi:hypothetical protein
MLGTPREHLPDAAISFGAQKAWRFWSVSDPSGHQAMFEFADRLALDRATTGEHGRRLVADFDRDWPDVKRSREILALAEEWSSR